MHHSPLVSVVMPLYNCEQFVRAAIDSILSQKFTDFEFLIIDDGSTDNSLSIARSYTDSRVRVLAEPHEGLVATLNRGLSVATGKYIARMDADDVSSPRRLVQQIAVLESCDDIVLVGCCARCINTEGEPVGNYVIPALGGKELAVALCASNQFVHGSIMMRTQAALAVSGYRDAFLTAEDYDLWLRLGEIGHLAHLPAFLYQLRVHPQSKSVLEGDRRRKACAAQARQYTLQRRLYGHDGLDYTTPFSGAALPVQPSLSMVALIEWAQICLWQGEIQLGINVLRRALSAQTNDARSWAIVPPIYLSKPYAREILYSFHRGTWIKLGLIMVSRLISQIAR